MIAYEIQLRYVIRDKIQSKKKSEKKIFCQKKNYLRRCLGFSVHKVSCLGQIDAYHHYAVYTYRNNKKKKKIEPFMYCTKL